MNTGTKRTKKSASDRRLALVVALTVVLANTTTRRARATEETKHRCIQAAEESQRLRDRGRLLDARAKLAICANAACPGIVATDCERWLADVEERLPSVVLSAKGPSGADLVDVRVAMDGRPLASGLDGRTIATDPGPHVFRFEASGLAPIETRVLLTEGERRRAVAVTFAAPSEAPPPTRSLLVPGILAGVAGASATGFVIFGLSAKNDYADLRGRCRGQCDAGVLDSPRREALVADVFLGVSVVALAAAAWLFSRQPEPSKSALSGVVSF